MVIVIVGIAVPVIVVIMVPLIVVIAVPVIVVIMVIVVIVVPLTVVILVPAIVVKKVAIVGVGVDMEEKTPKLVRTERGTVIVVARGRPGIAGVATVVLGRTLFVRVR